MSTNEKLHEYQRSRSFIDLGPNHSDSIFSNFIFLETAWSIEAKFYVEPPWNGWTKVWSNGLGHMTKMATKPIYSKNLKEILFSWTKWNLVCSIGCSSTTRFIQMMTLKWPWPILRQGKIWSPMILFGEKSKTMDSFSETIVVYDIKVGRCSQLNEYVKLHEYQRSRSFIDLDPNYSDSTFFKLLFSNNHLADWSQILFGVSLGWEKESKKISNDQELIQSDPISCPQNQKGNN